MPANHDRASESKRFSDFAKNKERRKERKKERKKKESERVRN